MRNSIQFVFMTALGIVAVACSPQTKVDKLKEKRIQLKTELAEIDNQIRGLDTTKTVLLPLVRSNNARIGKYVHQVIVQGEVQSDKTVMINAEANGILESIAVREGEPVKKGQVLAKIDTEILTSNIAELNTSLEFAEYNYEKQKELFDRGVGTEFELKQASNQLSSLKSQLSTLKAQRSKAVVRAPFSGIIDDIMMNAGEMTSMQSPLMRLVNNQVVDVSADISEHYYTKIKKGSYANAYFPTLNDTLDLQITSVGNYIHPTNRTFRVKAKVEENELLLPNMLAEMLITDLTLDSALVVPAAGLLKSQKNEDYIFALYKKGENWEVKEILVNVISRHKGEAAVETVNDELKAGTRIVTEGGRGITNGDIVRIL